MTFQVEQIFHFCGSVVHRKEARWQDPLYYLHAIVVVTSAMHHSTIMAHRACHDGRGLVYSFTHSEGTAFLENKMELYCCRRTKRITGRDS
jgi:hypothetical protein